MFRNGRGRDTVKGSPGVAFLGEVGIVLVAALIGGLVARALRLPVLLGYLLAGLVVGPYTPGFIADESAVRMVADLGVALLMFAVGVQFSLDELRHVGKTAVLGGALQIGGTIGLGLLIGTAFGWGIYGGLYLGCALALSSTAVMLKILEERGELGTTHGAVMLGILVVQDLSLILMIVLLPALAVLFGVGEAPAAAGGSSPMAVVGIALLKAALFLGGTLLLATRGVPALLDRVARTGSRELFLLTVVCLCLLAGWIADAMGLGMALGAFLAGMVVSESSYAHEVFSQVRPLRDVFASLFFVSVGMLLDPAFVAQNALLIGVVVIALLVGKSLVTMLAMRAFGLSGRDIIRVGLGLAQIGEFSFVLASVGAAKGLIPAEISGVILSSALISLVLTPFVFNAADPLYRLLSRMPLFSRWLESHDIGAHSDLPELGRKPRVIILGAGRVGRYVSDALRARNIYHVAVDYDSEAADRLRQNDVPVLYGDATSETVLEKAGVREADLAVVALPDAAATEMAVRLLKQMAPGRVVLARVHRGDDIPRMRAAGADAVIHAEFEAGTEMIRQTLDRLDTPLEEVDAYLDEVRQHRYRQESVP
jgi:monovalent cation:H+ antiporter-2, CPA2 family